MAIRIGKTAKSSGTSAALHARSTITIALFPWLNANCKLLFEDRMMGGHFNVNINSRSNEQTVIRLWEAQNETSEAREARCSQLAIILLLTSSTRSTSRRGRKLDNRSKQLWLARTYITNILSFEMLASLTRVSRLLVFVFLRCLKLSAVVS